MRRATLALAFGTVTAVGAFGACGGSPAPSEVAGRDAASDAATLEDGSGRADGADDGGSPDHDATAYADGGDASDSDAKDGSADTTPAVDANGPPFGCGTGSLQCFEVTQFCSQVTGPHGGVFYKCIGAPAGCSTDVTCACLAAQGIQGTCTGGDGGITVAVTEP